MKHQVSEEIPYGELTLNRVQKFLDDAAALGAPGSSELAIYSGYQHEGRTFTVYWTEK